MSEYQQNIDIKCHNSIKDHIRYQKWITSSMKNVDDDRFLKTYSILIPSMNTNDDYVEECIRDKYNLDVA